VAILADFAAARPAEVARRGNEWSVDIEAAPDVIAEADRSNVKVLGLEGFLIGEEGTYPALSRFAAFSRDPADVASRKSIELLAGEWSVPPGASDQMHPDAAGRHMIAIVLDE
jgi:hypothetical protein